jgi:hypothetical protein
MLVAASLEQSEIASESQQEAQLLDPQVCVPQMLKAIPRIGGLDQPFEHVERAILDAVAERELWLLGNFSTVGRSQVRNW